MFIHHWSKIVCTQITPADAEAISAEDSLKLVWLPREHDRGKTILILTKNQAVNGNIAEVKLVS